MNPEENPKASDLSEIVRSMIDHEQRAAGLYRQTADLVPSARLRAAFLRLSESHQQHVEELQGLALEDEAGATITKQINEMFL
jgi:rubrerythrin